MNQTLPLQAPDKEAEAFAAKLKQEEAARAFQLAMATAATAEAVKAVEQKITPIDHAGAIPLDPLIAMRRCAKTLAQVAPHLRKIVLDYLATTVNHETPPQSPSA